MLNPRSFLVLLPFLVVGCAKQVALETSSADAAMRSAEVSGADDIPQAALHLQLAREQLARAEELNAAGDEAEAKSMLTRAAADAELALLLSHEQSERDQADEALAKVAALRGAN